MKQALSAFFSFRGGTLPYPVRCIKIWEETLRVLRKKLW